ncbi:MAG: winged helix-turn-helix transcriptional regulator, partial [Ilumatobacteraceae bacterium]
ETRPSTGVIEPSIPNEIENLKPAPPGMVRGGSMSHAARKLSDRHVLLVARLLFGGPMTYSDLKERANVHSDTTLSTRLKVMVQNGLVVRTRTGRSVTYELAEAGLDTFTIFVALWEWERKELGRCNLIFHHACDRLTEASLNCDQCGHSIEHSDVELVTGSGHRFEARPKSRHHRRSTTDNDLSFGLIDPVTIGIVGNFWSTTILAGFFGQLRTFGQLATVLATPTAVLAERLHDLVRLGVVLPIESERRGYELTERGRRLYPTMMMFLRWGDRWTGGELGPPTLHRHVHCGQLFDPCLTCARCGRVFEHDDTTLALAT